MNLLDHAAEVTERLREDEPPLGLDLREAICPACLSAYWIADDDVVCPDCQQTFLEWVTP